MKLENNNLNSYIRTILKAIKDFLESYYTLVEEVKEATTEQIKDYYGNDDFEQNNIYAIAVNTDKEEELFEYADIDNYYLKNKYNNLEL